MGKYMRKSKTTGEIAVMEVTQSSLGVRTRAKTLALQRLQKLASDSPSQSSSSSASSYLQLRSRRLEKPPRPVNTHDSKRQRSGGGMKQSGLVQNPNPNCYNTRSSSRLRVGASSTKSGKNGGRESAKEESLSEKKELTVEEEARGKEEENGNQGDVGVEASFGENCLELDERGRSTRESTPCSLTRDPDAIRTPGSTTRPASSADANRILQNATRRPIPTANEMDEFFAGAEEQQQREFIEKYNFDPVNGKPLPGRYEWTKIDSKKV